MDIINALKRLERAGAENSKATKKLHQAAAEVAAQIERVVTVGVRLPRGYRKIEVRSNVGYEHFLIRKTGSGEYQYINGIGKYLHGDFNCEIPPQTRAGSLQFAKDIAEGLLDEIAEFLEQRKVETENAANVLEQAAEKLNSQA